jgi:acyl-coenzyme A thioesterase PaaI-like protein
MAGYAFQDAIGAGNVCWGCGPSNPHGLQIKSSWEGAESICRFRPDDCHIAAPGIVNGGILSSVIDCHCVCTAIAAYYKAEGRPIGSEPKVSCVTATLEVTFLRPTPTGTELVARARITEQTEKKVTLECSVSANGIECVRGRVVAARWIPKKRVARPGVPADGLRPAGSARG